jgi:hypothetical protein
MFKFAATNLVAAAIAAALVVSLAVVLTSMVPEAKAETLIQVPLLAPDAIVKADVIGKGSACSSQSWPHYEQGCQFDRRATASETRTVRVIALR